MTNKRKRKRRLKKSLTRRRKKFRKAKLEKAWRDIWVHAGILKKIP